MNCSLDRLSALPFFVGLHSEINDRHSVTLLFASCLVPVPDSQELPKCPWKCYLTVLLYIFIILPYLIGQQ
jgi:hypothetical protein